MLRKILLLLILIKLNLFAMSQKETSVCKIKVGDEPINMKSYSSPVYYDLDKDGLNDLILGEFGGGVRYYKNIGTKKNPAFNEFKRLNAGESVVTIPNY